MHHISPELLPRARFLRVKYCKNLTRFMIPTATESLNISECWNLEKLSVAVGTHESAMTSLHILFCDKLKCLPEIELFNLQVLKIYNCKKLVNGRKEWCLQRLPCLTALFIYHDGSDEEIQHWELPSSITRLDVCNLKTLSSQVFKSLTSLQYLSIEGNVPQIQSLLEEGGLPSSLSELHLEYHDELHSLHLCHLTSLLCLHLNCRNLQSLSESALPSSLSKLTIENCRNLQSLPVKGMPSSLSKLSISKCPLLTPLLEFDKGKYWPNIAQIPIIQFDWEHL